MVKRIHFPYCYNWFAWHFYHRHKKYKAIQRSIAWEFVNRLRTIPPGAIAIDCGANVGNVTAAFLKHGFEVHAFEPDPYAGSFIENRFGRNPRLHLHRAAVGIAPSTLTLYRSEKFGKKPKKATIESSLIKRSIHEDANAVQVDVIDLIAFMKQLPAPVALLKLDVEGSEADILERILDEGLHREIGAIYCETHGWFSPELDRRIQAIRDRVAKEKITNIQLDWM